MPIVKSCHVVLYRTGLTFGGLISFSVLLLLFTSCNEKERHGILRVGFDKVGFHKALTLLFDGVPPLDDGKAEEQTADPNSLNSPKSPEVIWSVHEPQKDCVRCHGNQQQRSFSREVQLTARMPELCYQCHEDLVPTALKGWVHGPVAVGQCLVCHEPHKTKNEHLLRRPVHELCYGCHEEVNAELNPAYLNESHSKCNNCHESHASSTTHLTASVPQLCYKCHEDLVPTVLKGSVHGPVAVGQCLLCHEMHRTKSLNLLRRPAPELCYGCHIKATVELISDHSKESYLKCNDCHGGHMSSKKQLLKPGWEETTVKFKGATSATGLSVQ
ncbi:cytochrome c3 family protein [Planctomycetota bacterium]